MAKVSQKSAKASGGKTNTPRATEEKPPGGGQSGKKANKKEATPKKSKEQLAYDRAARHVAAQLAALDSGRSVGCSNG